MCIKSTRVFLGLIFAFLTLFINRAKTQIEFPVDNTTIQEHKKFMSEFIRSLGLNEYVVYKNNKLTFFSKYSKPKTALMSFVSTVSLTLALLMCKLQYDAHMLNIPASYESRLMFGVYLLLTSLIIRHTVHRIDKHFNLEAYLTFDEKGILKNGKYVLEWKKLEKIDIEEQEYYKAATLLGSFGKTLTVIQEWDNECLPITFRQCMAILDHYWKTYRSATHVKEYSL